MNKSKVTYGLWLDSRYKLKTGNFQVKIRVTYQRKPKYYTITESRFLPFQFTESEWAAINQPNPRGKFRDIQMEKKAIEVRLQDTINAITNFSFEKFEQAWFNKGMAENPNKEVMLFEALGEHYKKLVKEKRAASAHITDANIKVLRKYFKDDVKLSSITADTLKDLERFLLLAGISMGTVSFAITNIKTVFNKAIREKLLDRDSYPFGDGKYRVAIVVKAKNATSKQMILDILNYEANTLTFEAYCRDLWVFSYLCNGMNLHDVYLLKYSCLSDRFLRFVRSKTASRTRTVKIITVPLLKQAIEIIERWGNKDKHPDNYIFNIFDKTEDAFELTRKSRKMSNNVNRHIKKIVKKLGYNVKISPVTARDAFATISLKQGRPLSDISQSLGHSDVSVTQHYLGTFSDEEKFQWQNELL